MTRHKHSPRVFIVKFQRGYLVCDYCGSYMSGNLTCFVERANVWNMRTKAIQMGDRYEKFFGKYTILEGESLGHIIHAIDMAEGNYNVNPVSVPGVHRQD